jgi:hypothetical protein
LRIFDLVLLEWVLLDWAFPTIFSFVSVVPLMLASPIVWHADLLVANINAFVILVGTFFLFILLLILLSSIITMFLLAFRYLQKVFDPLISSNSVVRKG